MCRPGAACAPICTSVCPLSAQLANLTAILGGPASTTPNRSSPSVTGPPKPTTARYLGIGNRSAIGTLVERTTRFTILLHLPDDHTAAAVAAAMIEAMGELPDHLRRSITWDRGSEMADWQDIKLQLDAPVFFCNPHSPWQRGTNENTNRLLRFWFEKGTDLSSYTKADLKRVQDKLNSRPRPTLDLATPAQSLAARISQAA